MASSIEREIKRDNSQVFRRAYIKRRLLSTGLFEDDWQEITHDVKKWGKISNSTDAQRVNAFKFGNVSMQLSNYTGRYNSESDQSSIWYGYASQQRTLLKIECGFLYQSLSSNGIWTNIEYPTDPTAFIGIISGEMNVTSENDITFVVKPLTQVFADFPVKYIDLQTGGCTASEFVTFLRDHIDAFGSPVFRPFFGSGTTTDWLITSTTINYGSLNPSQENGVYSKNCWEIIEQLAEVEGFSPFINRSGQFIFGPKTADSVSSYEFYGVGNRNTEYGHTIKKINSYGKKYSNYYSRVEVKWKDDDTSTSTIVKEGLFFIGGNNDAWNNGVKTYKLENLWIPNSATADNIAQSLFDDLSSLKNYIQFTTTFIPHISLLSKTNLSFDSSEINPTSLWDNNDWDELLWDPNIGEPVKLFNQEVKALSVEIDLDKLETVFIGSEI